MDKQQLIAAINEYITTNGVQEITGQVMNLILTSIANIIPDDTKLTSSYGGVVNPNDTISVTPGIGRWFIASAGEYTNNGGFIFEPKNLNILSYDGINWEKSEISFPFKSIDSIQKTSSAGLIDTYTISFTDGSLSTTFEVKNGSDGNIPFFEDLLFPALEGTQCIDNNIHWIVTDGQTATSTDVPGVSDKWVKIGGTDFSEDEFNNKAEVYPQTGTDILSDDLTGIDFSQFIPSGDGVSVFTYKAEKLEKLLKIRFKAQSAGTGVFTYMRNDAVSNIISTSLVAGWNDIDVDFDMLPNDLIGFSTLNSTATLFFKDGTGGRYYNISGTEINGNISMEVYGKVNVFKRVVTADLQSLETLNNVLYSFAKGYDVENVNLPNTQFGFIKNDGTIQAGTESRYSEISVVGYDKLKYMAARAVAADPSLYSSILIKKTDNSYVSLLANEHTSAPHAFTSEFFDLPPNSKTALIGWSNFENFENSTASVQLIKEVGVSEDSVLSAINSVSTVKPIGNQTVIYLEKPKDFLPVVNLIGTLPTDISPARAKTDMVLEMYNGSVLIFKCNIECKIQGSSSVNANKLNYAVKFINDAGSTLKIKIGDWNLDSSFHLKGYGSSDAVIVSRDISAANLLSQIFKSRPFPKSLVSDFPQYNATSDSNTSNFGEDANMTLRGFPIQLNRNGSFFGLYIWRQRRENGNFRMNDALKTNIYLANSNSVEYSIHTGFDPQYWELKSPKISGYQENGVINDATVMSHINNFFNWCTGINDGSINFEATAPNIINIENWVDVIILNQVVSNWDYYMNNLNLFFWGSKWSLGVTDLDNTAGLGNGAYGGNGALNWRGTFFPTKIYPALLSRIRTRYTELRNIGIIDLNNLYSIYSEIPGTIGETNYKNQLTLWGVNAFPYTNTGLHNTDRIMEILTQRITYLDSIWKL